jgi:iron complex outermembrane receptor protein
MRPTPLHQRFTPSPLALAAAMAIALAGGQAQLAHAQSGAPAAAAAPITFNIPAQPLGQALNELARQANLQMTFPAGLVAGKQIPAVAGNLTLRQALDRLLAGSGLVATVEGSSVVVRAAPPQQAAESVLPAVTVTASSEALPGELPKPYAGGQVARGARVGLLGNRDYMETPFTQTSYTAKTIQDQQAQDVIDVVANNAGTRSLYSANTYDDRLFIRGFFVYSTAWSFAGLTGLVPQGGGDISGVERVEISKGPTAMTNGMAPSGSVGGTLNFVPKRAGDTPTRQLTASYIGESILGAHLDIGQRFGDEKQFGVRFNGAYRDGKGVTDNVDLKLNNFTLGLDYAGDRTRASVDIARIDRRLDGQQGGAFVAAGVPIPPAPNAASNFYPAWGYYDTKNLVMAGRVEHDLTSNLTAFAAIGHRDTDGRYISNFPTINAAGNATGTPSFTANYADVWSGEAGLRWKTRTSSIGHELIVTVNSVEQEIGGRSTNLAAVTNNLYRPTSIPAPNLGGINTDMPRTSETRLNSLAIADVLSFDEGRAQLTLGLRHQSVKVNNFSLTGVQTSAYDRSEVTPAVGALYKLTPNISLFGNYIEALETGPTAPVGTANAGQVFPPLQSKQKELGVKADFNGLGGSLSYFDIARPSGVTIAVVSRMNGSSAADMRSSWAGRS